MNSEVKKLWLEALRDGKRKQTKAMLRDSEGFCCLGVLCDLYGEAHGVKWGPSSDYSTTRSFMTQVHLPPPEVMHWAGLTVRDPIVEEGETFDAIPLTLSGMNDGGASFLEIADKIEQKL